MRRGAVARNAGDANRWTLVFGMLFGSALIFVPVIGPVVGPLAATIVGIIEGAVEGAVVVGAISALGGALSAVGIPKVRFCSTSRSSERTSTSCS